METNESLDVVQEDNADHTVSDKDDYVIEEIGVSSDDQAAGKDAEIMEPKKGMLFRNGSLTLEHNHDLSPSETRVIACRRKTALYAKRRRQASNYRSEVRVDKKLNSTHVQAGDSEDHQFGGNDCTSNSKEERRLKIGAGDTHVLYRYLFCMQSKNPNFFYIRDLDEDSQLRNVFWADARCRAAYESFSDVVKSDTTYLASKYEVPFVSFIGVNHHGDPIILGCGLLSNGNTKTFVWLFKSWLACMSKKPPKSIITSQCKAIQDAVEEVFAQTYHRWCISSIMKKIPRKLSGFSEFENITTALSNVVYESLTEKDFENSWMEIVCKFGIHNNKWLIRLYCNRKKWVPAYLKVNFWADIDSIKEFKSENGFFNGFVRPGITLNQFLEQYDSAQRDMVEKENNADCKSCQEVPPCITHYDIEKQFQSVYTNKKFEEFQEQLKDKIYCYPSLLRQEASICTFKVVQDVKIKEEQLSMDFIVWFKEDGCDVRCMCRHFDIRGILCSHIISVLSLMKINEVPSKYVLKRWRKDLKRSHTSITCPFDDMVSTPVSQRFDELCKAFYEVAEKAATSDELFIHVMGGLQELKAKVEAPRAVHDNQESNRAEHENIGT
ncbi:hypothetical protein ACP4OV_011814 [Aristida adscensionis]